MDINKDLKHYCDFWIGMDAIYDKWAKNHNITVNALFTLQIIFEMPECTQKTLCNTLFMPKQTISATLSSLIKSGYVQKKTSPDDQRSNIILLTESGKSYANYILTELNQFELSALNKMTLQERSAMIAHNQLFLTYLSQGLQIGAKK